MKKADEVLDILKVSACTLYVLHTQLCYLTPMYMYNFTPAYIKNASDDRDCENKLVLLLGYEQFQFIKLLFKNRWTVLYCTQLAKTDSEAERKVIEEEMKSDPEKASVLKVQYIGHNSCACTCMLGNSVCKHQLILPIKTA